MGQKIKILPDKPKSEWTELPDNFKIVHEGNIGNFHLQAGDIIHYKKNKLNGQRTQHALIYCGNNTIAEAGIGYRYPNKRDIHTPSGPIKWETQEVDRDTIQVIRITETQKNTKSFNL